MTLTPSPHRRPWWRRLVAPVAERRTWSAVAYLLTGVPLGALWLVLVGGGLLVGGATAVLGVGLPLLVGTLLLTRRIAELDRRLVNAVLGAEVAATGVDLRPRPSGPLAVARAVVRSPLTWRSTGWVLFRAVGAVLVLAGAVLTAGLLAALLVVPFQDGYLQWGDTWRSRSGWSQAWTLPVGLLGLLGSLHVARVLAAVHVRVAHVLLGPDPGARVEVLSAQARRAQERLRLARDLHDSIGHAMTLVVVQAGAAGTAVDRDPAFVRQALTGIAETARSALDELDAALATLRDDPVVQRPGGTLEDVPELLARAAAAGLDVDLRWPDRPAPAVSDDVSQAAYRIVQEACTNVLRHGGPLPSATVALQVRGALLHLAVRSPLRAPAGDPQPRRGLVGAAARADAVGGTLSAGPTPDGAWLVEASLPVSDVPVLAPR